MQGQLEMEVVREAAALAALAVVTHQQQQQQYLQLQWVVPAHCCIQQAAVVQFMD